MQAIVWAYKCRHGGTDPEYIRGAPDSVKDMAEHNYKQIKAVQCIPGHNEIGELTSVTLAEWIGKVRQSAGTLSRADVADTCIGKLLSNSSIGTDGIWPGEGMRQVMGTSNPRRS